MNKCKCGKNIDTLYENGNSHSSSLLSICFSCRIVEIPKHIPYSQYAKYWLQFSKDERKE